MTRWDILKDVIMAYDVRRAVGKAWPFFFCFVFHSSRSNKWVISYHELSEILKENTTTIKQWRDHLEKHKVLLDRISTYGNMSLLPIIAELSTMLNLFAEQQLLFKIIVIN